MGSQESGDRVTGEACLAMGPTVGMNTVAHHESGSPVARDNGSVPGARPLVALPAIPAGDVVLCHGHTLVEVNRLATAAVARDVFHQSLAFSERVEIAWSAIVEALYSAQVPPRSGELIRAAWKGLRAHVEDEWHTHGISRAGIMDGSTDMRNFWRFWWAQTRQTPGPEAVTVERLAFAQIWPRLSQHHRRLLTAMAVHDDYGRAAEALNKKRSTFVTQISGARKAFFALWHEGEKPAGLWGQDRRRSGNRERPRLATEALHRRKLRRAKTGA